MFEALIMFMLFQVFWYMKSIRLIPTGVSEEIPTSVFKAHDMWCYTLFRSVCKIAESDCQLLHVGPYVCPSASKKIGSNWKHFQEISSLNVFPKIC